MQATPALDGSAADGSVHIRELALRPSDLWSPAFKAFNAELVREFATAGTMPVPARTAGRKAWDEFDTWLANQHSGRLAAALERYPVEVIDTTLAGVRVGIISPKAGIAPENRNRVLINLHGGGFVYHRGLTMGLLESVPVAAIARTKIITVDYHQAPFHGYPAASEDVEKIYREMLQQYEPGAIGIFGCSGGGTLTAQSTSWLLSRQLPRPGAVGIFSIGLPPPCVPAPWGRGWGDSAVWFSTRAPSNELSDSDRVMWEPVQWYMEGIAADDAVAYPGSSDAVLRRFPPTLFLTGTRDFSLSSAAAGHARLLQLGIDSQFYVMEGATHAAHVFAVGTPEAHDAQRYVAHWFQSQLAR